MVSVFDFGLKKVLLVEKENELCVCEEFIVQHLLEHIQGLSQPICVGIFPKHLINRSCIFSHIEKGLARLRDVFRKKRD